MRKWFNQLRMTSGLLLALVAVAQVGCQDWAVSYFVRTDRVVLFDGIESYQSVREFKELVSRKSLTIDSEDISKPVTGNRPPFDYVELGFTNYKHLGCIGDAKFVFFNDRLSEVIFRPANPTQYSQALEAAGIRFDSHGRYRQSRFVELYRNAGHDFVSWEDIRLRKEQDDWISRFS